MYSGPNQACISSSLETLEHGVTILLWPQKDRSVYKVSMSGLEQGANTLRARSCKRVARIP